MDELDEFKEEFLREWPCAGYRPTAYYMMLWYDKPESEVLTLLFFCEDYYTKNPDVLMKGT
jgi:hypothetical protein